jgi:predicted GNAT family acetyltransferase
MNITNEENPSGGRYVTELEGHQAEMTYSRTSPKLIIIDHTGVPDALRGKGVGQALALHAVEEARKGGWKYFRSARSSRRNRCATKNGTTSSTAEPGSGNQKRQKPCMTDSTPVMHGFYEMTPRMP